MILQKEHYSQMKKYLTDDSGDEKLGLLLENLNTEVLYEMMRRYERKEKEILNNELRLAAKYSDCFNNYITKKDTSAKSRRLFLMGEFVGIYKVISRLLALLLGKEKGENKLFALCTGRAHIKEILIFLYYHPNVKHKDLAEKIGIKPNYLNELMKLLEPTGSINKYSYGKFCYYELSLDGQKYVEDFLKEKQLERENGYLHKNINMFHEEREPYRKIPYKYLPPEETGEWVGLDEISDSIHQRAMKKEQFAKGAGKIVLFSKYNVV